MLNFNDVNALYSLRIEKYNKNEFLQDLKETGQSLVKFHFKLGYVEEPALCGCFRELL